MPVMVLFKHQGRLTIAVINRRANKLDESKDVLGKVTLISGIDLAQPHRGHLDILAALALPKLVHPQKKPITDFDTLHAAWEQIFNVELLNERFYRELANWYFWALPQVEFPADLEANDEKRRATGLIRLLTRLIFCWFLKEKGLIPEKLFHPTDLKTILTDFDDDSSTYYQAILQNLFFATLNQRMGEDAKGQPYRVFAKDEGFLKNRATYDVNNLYRYEALFREAPDAALAHFADIPFLNGGLFECLDRTEDGAGKKRYLDGFSRNPKKRPAVPNRLFFGGEHEEDLSEAYGDTKRKKEKVSGLIPILNRYKFTIVENTPIDQEIALDPELLGKVFENLLASYNEETRTTARKQTGSFYTPRPIVDYMVDESLKAHLTRALVEKAGMKEADALAGLDLLFAYTEKEHAFTGSEVACLIAAIDALKILDPACGSGAFPMGVLHKLVYILGKLDPDNERWKQTQLAKLDSAPMREELERAFADNNDDYGRKLYLIENCLYGVDIQPIAIQITKLRFFISLVCDQKIHRDKAKNHGIRPLPNLETKFVAANTLIGLPEMGQMELVDSRVGLIEKEIEALYHSHFSIQRRDQKLAVQRKFKAFRKEMADLLAQNLMSRKQSEHIADWDPFDPQVSADFFDPHWMFGRSLADGFDVVIGNPPYVSKQALQKQAPDFATYARANFKSAMGRDFDLFALFIEKSVSLLRPHGVLCWIVPTGWYTGPGFSELRRFVMQRTDPRLFINLPYDMFEEAWVDTTLFLATRRAEIVRWPRSETCEAMLKTFAKRERLDDPAAFVNGAAFVNIATWFKNGEDQFLTRSDENVLTLLQKIRKASAPLSECADVQRGVTPFHLTEKAVHPNSVLAFDGKVRRYTATLGTPRYIRYDESLAEYKPQRYFKGVRILLRELISRQMRLQATLVTLDCVSNKSMQTVLPKPDLHPSYLLGVLNSNLLSWYFLQRSNVGHRDDFPKIVLKETRDLPVPVPGGIAWSGKSHDQIVALVDRILAAKQADTTADTSTLEREIDQQVYALYGLTPEEIAIVEGVTK
ncbi:MAG: TaqI-like C-terminal specificity domain-containing protein [Candidatus Contendobacter sp.]